MDKTTFQARASRSASMLMEAIEDAEALMKMAGAVGTAAGQLGFTLDADFANSGAAFQAVIDALGSGTSSKRALLDKIRS